MSTQQQGGARAGRGPRWSLYLVRRVDGALYAGIALDVERRFAEHAAGGARSARSLRGRGPLVLVRRCVVGEKGLALSVERRFKRLPKKRKEALARSSRSLAGFVARWERSLASEAPARPARRAQRVREA